MSMIKFTPSIKLTKKAREEFEKEQAEKNNVKSVGEMVKDKIKDQEDKEILFDGLKNNLSLTNDRMRDLLSRIDRRKHSFYVYTITYDTGITLINSKDNFDLIKSIANKNIRAIQQVEFYVGTNIAFVSIRSGNVFINFIPNVIPVVSKQFL